MPELSSGFLSQATIGLVLSLSIGLACRLFNLPLPAPPTFIGVLMIAGLALGYFLGGYVPGR
jgi:XapX domain-containing protein